ncbi:MAG: helix-turn-helix transcriptional regulator [Bacillota bacterium]
MENNIKAWRESRGLTQQQVADIFRDKYGKSTIKYQSISAWERGSSPSLEIALILAEILQVLVEQLFVLDS